MKENKTLQKASNSLLKLSKTKDYDHISVTDIVKDCNMSRQNFYKNFENKEELIHEIFVFHLCCAAKETIIFNVEKALLRLVLIFYDNKDFYLGLFHSSAGAYLFQMMLDYGVSLCRCSVSFSNTPVMNIEKTLLLKMYISGCITMLFRFLSDEESISVETLCTTILTGLPEKLSGYINLKNLTSEFMVHLIKKHKENWYYEKN